MSNPLQTDEPIQVTAPMNAVSVLCTLPNTCFVFSALQTRSDRYSTQKTKRFLISSLWSSAPSWSNFPRGPCFEGGNRLSFVIGLSAFSGSHKL
jgi:hypothetical protein